MVQVIGFGLVGSAISLPCLLGTAELGSIAIETLDSAYCYCLVIKELVLRV